MITPKRPKVVTFRVDSREEQLLERLADVHETDSVSATIRKIIRLEARRHQLLAERAGDERTPDIAA